MSLSSIHAEHIMRAAQSSATRLGVAACIAVLDSGGHLKALVRMDRAWLGAVGFRAAVAYSNGGASAVASINGNAPVPVYAASAVAPTMLSIGSARNGQFLSSQWTREVKYWPRRLSDAELFAATRLS